MRSKQYGVFVSHFTDYSQNSDLVNVTWHRADLAYPNQYREKIEQFAPEAVVCLSWQDIPDFSLKKSIDNLEITITLLDFVTNLKSCKSISVGSCLEYGKVKGSCQESESVFQEIILLGQSALSILG